MSADNGGPAFPLVELERTTGDVCDQHFGLSVRDYFAAKAMQVILTKDGLCIAGHSHEGVAQDSYMMADAMLAARAKP